MSNKETTGRKPAPKKRLDLAKVILPEVEEPNLPYTFCIKTVSEQDERFKTIKACCLNCRTIFQTEVMRMQKEKPITCPICGRTYEDHPNRRTETGVLFDNIVVDGRPFFVMRFFEKTADYLDWEERKLSQTIQETTRYFMDKKSIRRYKNDAGVWEPAQFKIAGRDQLCQLIQPMDEIRRIVAEGPAKRTALPEYFEFALTEDDPGAKSEFALADYLHECVAAPRLKELLRNKLTRLAAMWNNGVRWWFTDHADTEPLASVLGFTDTQLKTLRKINPDVKQLRLWERIFEVLPDETAEDYTGAEKDVNACQFGTNSKLFEECVRWIIAAIRILKNEGVNLCMRDVSRYLHVCFWKQYIPPYDAMLTWVKYLKEAKGVYDLTDKDKLYPDCLRTALDELKFQKERDAFENKNKKNADGTVSGS